MAHWTASQNGWQLLLAQHAGLSGCVLLVWQTSASACTPALSQYVRIYELDCRPARPVRAGGILAGHDYLTAGGGGSQARQCAGLVRCEHLCTAPVAFCLLHSACRVAATCAAASFALCMVHSFCLSGCTLSTLWQHRPAQLYAAQLGPIVNRLRRPTTAPRSLPGWQQAGGRGEGRRERVCTGARPVYSRHVQVSPGACVTIDVLAWPLGAGGLKGWPRLSAAASLCRLRMQHSHSRLLCMHVPALPAKRVPPRLQAA